MKKIIAMLFVAGLITGCAAKAPVDSDMAKLKILNQHLIDDNHAMSKAMDRVMDENRSLKRSLDKINRVNWSVGPTNK